MAETPSRGGPARPGRRTATIALATGAASVALPSSAAFPERTVRLVSPFPPGGQVPTIAYLMSQRMGTLLGQPMVLDTRPGAAGTIAAGFVAKAPKDGHTLLFATSSMLGIAKFVNRGLPYDPVADFAPVIHLGSVAVGMFASRDGGIQSLDDLIARAKASPGRLNFSSPGIGSVSHLAAELFKARAKVDLTHVPYPGFTAQITDLIGGRTELAMGGAASGAAYLREGRVRLLAMAAARRSRIAPDVPALGDVLPGYDAPAWLGIVAPAGTSADIVARLHAGIQTVLRDPELKPLFDGQALDVGPPMSPRGFGDKIRREMSLWEEAVRASGMQAQVAR